MHRCIGYFCTRIPTSAADTDKTLLKCVFSRKGKAADSFIEYKISPRYNQIGVIFNFYGVVAAEIRQLIVRKIR
jgi:hypothetical protein